MTALVWFLLLLSPARDAAAQMDMNGLLGSYPMTREASGTSWQPESTPFEGARAMEDGWMLMGQGWINGGFDDQGGPRGGRQFLTTSMFMGMAEHDLGPGALGLRSMLSLDPLNGPDGYRELLQTGETGNGVTPLIDRQHPHNLFMEMAATYSLPVSDDGSLFVYGGLPGEPALGPTVFMMRASGEDLIEAPITHHWLDSTHVDFGVLTLGGIWDDVKLEGSAFNGREPDQYRWGYDTPALDSYSGRLTWNPTQDLSVQGSWGRLKSPEQLTPNVDQDRTTASATWNLRLGGTFTQTTFAWGRDDDDPGTVSDAFLLESETRFSDNTVMWRLERVTKDDLFFPGAAQAGVPYTVNAFDVGYVRDLPAVWRVRPGVGASLTFYALPAALDPVYGRAPVSGLVWVRLKMI